MHLPLLSDWLSCLLWFFTYSIWCRVIASIALYYVYFSVIWIWKYINTEIQKSKLQYRDHDMFSKFTWCKVVAGGWSLHMSMSKSQRKLGIPLQQDSGHLDTATVATCVHWKSGKNLCVWQWWWWWIYRTPVWQLSKLAGLLSQHRHHYKQQAPGGNWTNHHFHDCLRCHHQ